MFIPYAKNCILSPCNAKINKSKKFCVGTYIPTVATNTNTTTTAIHLCVLSESSGAIEMPIAAA